MPKNSNVLELEPPPKGPDAAKNTIDSPEVSTAPPADPPDAPPKNKGGRPRKADTTFLTQFPIPAKFEFLKPDEFFAYLRSIPKDKRKRGMLTFYRYKPIKVETDPDYIRKIALDGENYPFDNEDWESAVLHVFGSGKYGCYLNEQNEPPETGRKTICRIFNIETRWDLENFPPVMAPQDVDYTQESNALYIQWLANKGVRTPSQISVETEGEMAASEALVEMTKAFIGSQQRASIPVPPAPVRESAAEKLTLEGASAVIGMVKENAKSMTQVQTAQSDPVALLNSFVGVARELRGDDSGIKVMLQSLADQLRDAQAQNAQLVNRLIDAKTAQPVAVAADKPKGLIEQLRDLRDAKEILSDLGFMPAGGAAAEEGSKAIPSSMKEMAFNALAQNAPVLIQGGLQLVDRLIQGATAVTAVAKGQPVPEVAKTPEVSAPQQNPQQQQAPINVPGKNEQEVREIVQTFMAVGTQMLDQFKLAVAGTSDPPVDGFTFAEMFIAWFNGEVPNYTRIVAFCRMPDGSINVDPLIQIAKNFPVFWGQISSVENEFRQFLTEFVTLKEAQTEEAGQQPVQ